MRTADKNPTHLTVTKSNKIVEASYMLSVIKQRILWACIAQIDPTVVLTEEYIKIIPTSYGRG